MSTSLTADLRPELALLTTGWQLPAERLPAVEALLRAHQENGATAYDLPAGTPSDPSAWGGAARPFDDQQTPTPLVLSPAGQATCLQAWRFFHAERTIARELLSRARRPGPPLRRPAAGLIGDLPPGSLNPRQQEAVQVALEKPLALITGGPGTGKTHALARLLALLLLDQPGNPPTVLLAAPTGKAALRMRDAVRSAVENLGERFQAARADLNRIAAGASTLHQLLGFNPGTGRCRFGPDQRLRADVVIIDECSMVDTLLWQALLAALPDSARLILLGDPHQLESVAAGDVLGSLVFLGEDGSASPLAPVWVELVDSHRFRKRPGIGRIADAVVRRAPADALALLESHRLGTTEDDGLRWLGEHANRFRWEALPEEVRTLLLAVARAGTPEDGLAALDRVRLLTAHRETGLGALSLSTKVQDAIAQELKGDSAARTPNQPIIVNRNDPETGLKNGSVGLIMAEGGGRVAYFPGEAGRRPVRVEVSQLPDHSAAWAMTVHRSQGSEFDHVVFVLPDTSSRLATRELVYTAITRAKHQLHLWGSPEVLTKALAERPRRRTLLPYRLRDTPAG